MAYETTTTTVAKRRGRPAGTANKKRKYTRRATTLDESPNAQWAAVQTHLAQIQGLTRDLADLAWKARDAYLISVLTKN